MLSLFKLEGWNCSDFNFGPEQQCLCVWKSVEIRIVRSHSAIFIFKIRLFSKHLSCTAMLGLS